MNSNKNKKLLNVYGMTLYVAACGWQLYALYLLAGTSCNAKAPKGASVRSKTLFEYSQQQLSWCSSKLAPAPAR